MEISGKKLFNSLIMVNYSPIIGRANSGGQCFDLHRALCEDENFV